MLLGNLLLQELLFVGGVADVTTEEIVFRQTGSKELSETAGFVGGFSAAILSAGPISKGVSKVYSANPRVVGTPKAVAYDLGDDSLRLVRSSKVKTGVGPFGKSYDVVDDLTISKLDFADEVLRSGVKKGGISPTKYYNFEPLKLSDDVFANRYTIKGVDPRYAGKEGLLAFDDLDIEKVYWARGNKGASFSVSDDALKGIDFSKFEGTQRIKEVTFKDSLKKTFGKPTVYDDSIESVTGFGDVLEESAKSVTKKGYKTYDLRGITGSQTEPVDDLFDNVFKEKYVNLPTQKKLKGTQFTELGRNQPAVIDSVDDFVDDVVPRYSGKKGLIKVEGQVDDFIGRAYTKDGATLFTDNFEDYSKALSFKAEKGVTKSAIESGDEILITPTQKFRADTITFAGDKGRGAITKLNVDDYADEFILRIDKADDVLPKSDVFTKVKVSDATKGLGITSLDKGDDVLLLGKGVKPKPPKVPKLPKSSTGSLSDLQLDDILKKSGVSAKSNIKSLSKTGTISLTKTGTTTGSISGSITAARGGTGTISLTKVKTPPKTETGTKSVEKTLSESKSRFGYTSRFKDFEKAISGSRRLFSDRFVSDVADKSAILPRASSRDSVRLRDLEKFNIKQVEATLTKPTQIVGQPTADATRIAEGQATTTSTISAFKLDVPAPPQLQTPTLTPTRLAIPTPPVIPPKIPIIKIPRIDPDPKDDEEVKKLPKGTRQGYNVYVRKGIGRGMFDKVLVAENVPKKKAISMGLKQAAKYTQRTAIIEKGKPTRKKDISKVSKKLLKQFRGPKPKSKIRENGAVFIEKSKHAIDTKQEKQGIPYKAATTKRLFSGKRKISFKTPKLKRFKL